MPQVTATDGQTDRLTYNGQTDRQKDGWSETDGQTYGRTQGTFWDFCYLYIVGNEVLVQKIIMNFSVGIFSTCVNFLSVYCGHHIRKYKWTDGLIMDKQTDRKMDGWMDLYL